MLGKKESPETYTILLQSDTGVPAIGLVKPFPYTNINNVTWRVDYDNLFNGRQELFEFCRVRFQLIGGPGSYTPNNQRGYLTASLPTSFNAQTTIDTILGVINPTGESVGGGIFLLYGQGDIGVDIDHKQLTGIQPLNIKWAKVDNSLITGLTGYYSMELMFEFYNI